LAIEMSARGLSVRDIEDAFKDENGRLLLSKTAVFAKRDLSEYKITYLSLTALPSGCVLAPSASQFWRPGAIRLRAAACCCI
jgi:hypothetical protein